MKKALKVLVILVIVIYFISNVLPNLIGVPLSAYQSYKAWNDNERGVIIKRDSTEELNKIIQENMRGKSDFNPEIALESIIKLYLNKGKDFESNERPIDIYVIYGTGYWKENLETFEIIFAHQKVDQNNGNLYEYRIEMIYDPIEFRGVEEFDVGYDSTMDIDGFKKSIINSIGFEKASNSKPMKIEIIKESI